jgi:hypothetical protein
MQAPKDLCGPELLGTNGRFFDARVSKKGLRIPELDPQKHPTPDKLAVALGTPHSTWQRAQRCA